MSHNTTIKIDDNSTAAVGLEILSTKYRIKLRNVFQLDFATKRIHINMPRSSSIFFLRSWQMGALREHYGETSHDSYFQGT